MLTPAQAAEAILECILRVVIERGIEAMVRKARAAGTCWLLRSEAAELSAALAPASWEVKMHVILSCRQPR